MCAIYTCLGLTSDPRQVLLRCSPTACASPHPFTRHTHGELLERVDGDVNLLANFFTTFIIYIAANVLMLIGILAMLLSLCAFASLC